jgi:4-aminobutyrate aminotransferase-like enzyme
VIELDLPCAGIYVASRRGVYVDLYLGVAQRLFDDERIAPMLEPLVRAGLLLRREINTDDYLGFAPDGVHLPQDVAKLVTAEMARAFPRPGGYRVFFSNSGTESVEAALKACALHGYRRFLRRFGHETWAAACAELGVEPEPPFADGKLVWRDYPLFFLALERAFHGRTLGSLSLTRSRPVQRIGFASWRRVRHVSRDDPSVLDCVVDRRPVPELLRDPGALAGTVAAGRIPIDLLAGAFIEPFQGEGGYRMPADSVLAAIRALCDASGAVLVADEVQTFARTGGTFLCESRGLRPDIVCVSKASVVGLTILPAGLATDLEPGWHANTFGSGRLFDINYAFAVIDTFLNGQEPAFAGLSFAENEAAKGTYFGERFADLAARHPGQLSELDGRGCMWGFTVPERDRFVAEAWRQGAKMLGAGYEHSPGRVRVILPADVLTKEIDDVVNVLDRTCAALAGGR